MTKRSRFGEPLLSIDICGITIHCAVHVTVYQTGIKDRQSRHTEANEGMTLPVEVNCHVIHFAFPFWFHVLHAFWLNSQHPPSLPTLSSPLTSLHTPPSFMSPLYPRWGIMPRDCVKLCNGLLMSCSFSLNDRTCFPLSKTEPGFPSDFFHFASFPLLMLLLSIMESQSCG